MARQPEMSIEVLDAMIKKLDSIGYESVLLLYGSKIPDYWIKVARTLDPSHKIKYMFAMRPYAVSPDHLYIMTKSFNEIQEDRLMINFVSGEFYPEEIDPTDADGIDISIEDKEKRRLYVKKFVKKYVGLFEDIDVKPIVLVSGGAPTAVKTARDYADYSLVMYKDFLFKPETFHGIDKVMINFSVLMRPNMQEAEVAVAILSDIDKMNTVYGTQSDIIDAINILKDYGINDILIDRAHCEEDADYIHDFVKELIDASV